jgi:hypothetical protein
MPEVEVLLMQAIKSTDGGMIREKILEIEQRFQATIDNKHKLSS